MLLEHHDYDTCVICVGWIFCNINGIIVDSSLCIQHDGSRLGPHCKRGGGGGGGGGEKEVRKGKGNEYYLPILIMIMKILTHFHWNRLF